MIYDTSVVVKCMDYLKGTGGDSKACDVLFSDDNCIIPPTAVKELYKKPRTDVLNKIENHCKFMTYDDYPFNVDDNREHVEEFADHIRLEWINKTPKGHSEIARLKRAFNREVQRGKVWRPRCHGSGNLEHKVNDYRILKEANILAEYEIGDILVSADWSHTDPVCLMIYEKIMEEYLPEEYREDFVINVKFYKDL